MLSSLFILADTGDIIIEKHWRGIINRSICEYFWDQKISAESEGSSVAPVITTPKYYLVNIKRTTIYFLGVLQNECSPLLVVDFLQRIYDVFIDYFGQNLNESIIRDNFVHVYQLIEEMADNGFPFTTEPNFLKEMIKPPNVVSNLLQGVTGTSNISDNLPNGSLGAIQWRKTGIKYTSNEIFFDIIEEIDCIIDSNGFVVSCEVNGEIQVNCKLSGMPDLTLTFNNPRMLDDVSFHPCVRYSRWENDRVLSFIPPDGSFKLMNYRIKGINQLPIYVKPQISFGEGGGRVNVLVGSKNTNNKPVENVFVTIPFPKTTTAVNLTSNVGGHFTEDKVCKWNIGKIPKEKTPMLSGNVVLAAGQPLPEANPSIMVQFKIAMFTISGLGVDSLACSEKYKPFKGVRSVTRAGKFQVRA
ncbi:hypothetical protein PPL_05261 [Heterostelium album PN500]|uniref:MHD domain-containing protein n=1 Tax=Heterostelium pallidum (strain ATCC 26659 / Pp 5 / PN500) TaxID=670386 RepID=D3BB75_HETP5|nr:hypothetical protein PPL_05261 [Heterostelium album PN500]EFA81282.1 hypothetical protein PPL_05261 [Heterostelium album PN500]|eukprot:XP_020433400.1 hypothetical protein PPL_05261 [Heterostelium album PN500]